MTEFPETRASLLAAVRSPSDLKAWDEFVLTYRPAVYRMARRRGMQDADAQDVTQDILIRIAGAIGRYERTSGTRFRHWLRRVAKNAILSALSRAPKDAASGASDVWDLLEEHADPAPELTREFDAELRREQYFRAAAIVRADVNPETWQAFEMTVIGGHSCEAAARSIGKSTGTVYAARSRVVKRLREQIEYMQKGES